MIKYAVKCTSGHEFEGWFKDSAGFDAQVAAGDIACPRCGDTSVSKAPMAPRIAKRRSVDSQKIQEHAQQYMAAAAHIRQTVEENCDYVGEQFAEEARKIHYGETEERGIYGEASPDDARALDEEGIDVLPLPQVRRAN